MNNLNADAVDAEIEATKRELTDIMNVDSPLRDRVRGEMGMDGIQRAVHAVVRLQTRMHALKATAALAAPVLSGEELRVASEKVDEWVTESTPEQALRAHIASILTDVDHFDGCHTMVEGDGTCTCLAGRLQRAIDAGRVTEPRQDGAA